MHNPVIHRGRRLSHSGGLKGGLRGSQGSAKTSESQQLGGGILARELTGLRVAKAFLNNTTSTESTLECDFDLTRGEGIAIYRIQMEMSISDVVADNSFQSHAAHFSVHVENDNLETVQEGLTADSFQNDSEIIFETGVNVWVAEEAATRGGSAVALHWMGPDHINFIEVQGKPLVIAINPTVRAITTDAEMLISGNFTYYYKYVELTDREVRDAFFRSR